MTDEVQSSTKKPGPPTLGLAMAADLWLWGALLLFAPPYLGITSWWQNLFYVLGGIFLTISFGGTVRELGILWRSEGLSYWSSGLVFLIPSVALYVAVGRRFIAGAFSVAAKIIVLIFTAIGGALFFEGIPYFFWKQGNNEDQPSSVSVDESSTENERRARRRVNFQVIANTIIALLSLTTAVVTLVEKLSP